MDEEPEHVIENGMRVRTIAIEDGVRVRTLFVAITDGPS